jgi:hypothetical protein
MPKIFTEDQCELISQTFAKCVNKKGKEAPETTFEDMATWAKKSFGIFPTRLPPEGASDQPIPLCLSVDDPSIALIEMNRYLTPQ